jgi:hypothetical protein
MYIYNCWAGHCVSTALTFDIRKTASLGIATSNGGRKKGTANSI